MTDKTAKKQRVYGKPFKKGSSGNPNGRPKLNPDIVKIRKMLNDELAKASELLTMTPEQAAEILSNPETSVLQGLMGRAIKKSDWKIVEAILQRIIGKVPDMVQAKVVVSQDPVQLKRMATEYLEDED